MLKRMCDEDLILNCNKSDIVVNACLGPHFPEANASGKCLSGGSSISLEEKSN